VRAVVVGGSGQLGGWLLRHLARRGHDAVGTYATVPTLGLERLDAADPGAPDWVRDHCPEVVFYPAGFTWVDGCERDPAKARAANVEQPLAIAGAAADVGARFVYFSTDYLFDGRNGPYGEDAEPCPLNEYGRAKLEAEQRLAESFDDAVLIARTCWVFGPERQGKNFAYQVVKTLKQGKPLACPSDQAANPSYGPDVALAAVLCAELGLGGVIHLAGPDFVDRSTFARAIARSFGLDDSCIESRTTSELALGAARPLAGGLRSARLGAFLPGLIRGLDAALADFRGRLSVGEPWANPLA
jgi:dTDP-4-dehydrorhamnose reductase